MNINGDMKFSAQPTFGKIKGERVTDGDDIATGRDTAKKTIEDGSSSMEAVVGDSFCYVLDTDKNMNLKLSADNLGTLFVENKESDGETAVEIKNAVPEKLSENFQDALKRVPSNIKIASIEVEDIHGNMTVIVDGAEGERYVSDISNQSHKVYGGKGIEKWNIAGK